MKKFCIKINILI